MNRDFEEDVDLFLSLAQKHKVRMMMVGGGIKISPVIDIETFTYDVISFEDLINSKIKAGRPKDLYDIMELRRIRGESVDS